MKREHVVLLMGAALVGLVYLRKKAQDRLYNPFGRTPTAPAAGNISSGGVLRGRVEYDDYR